MGTPHATWGTGRERGSRGALVSFDEIRLAVPDSVVGRIQGGRPDTSTTHEYDLR